ncbi:hypothetical protein M0R45_010805 [Rubus argutus]|uniref:Uncharacterized protein n=1 Tax=Rubus argutus TaxID=59490 RepID=A0AAW1YBW4_RUBAR
MPSTLGRNLNLCFTKIKRPLMTLQSLPPDDQTRSSPTTTLPTPVISALIKNFNSLYDGDHAFFFDSATSIKSSDLSNPDTDNTAADFATVFASQRFFFSSPGRSNSIVDQSSSSRSATSSSSDLHAPFKHNSVVVADVLPRPLPRLPPLHAGDGGGA